MTGVHFLNYLLFIGLLSLIPIVAAIFIGTKTSVYRSLIDKQLYLKAMQNIENFIVVIDRKSHVYISREMKSIQYVQYKEASPLILFDELLRVELIEKDQVINSVNTSLIGSIAGGILFGPGGAWTDFKKLEKRYNNYTWSWAKESYFIMRVTFKFIAGKKAKVNKLNEMPCDYDKLCGFLLI